MSLWAGFLRGINLGKRQMKMAQLKACLEDAGLTEVKTVLASGNVRFHAEGPPEKLQQHLETAIAGAFGFDVGVVLRSDDELRAMLAADPFRSLDAGADVTCHVLMFDRPLPDDMVLDSLPGDTEILRIDPRDIYIAGYRRPNGRYTEGVEDVLKPLYAQIGRKGLDTMRNWNTIEKILK